MSIGIKVLPKSVNSYSVRGGTSAYRIRFTSPTDSSVFRCPDNTFGDMSGIALDNSLKRITPNSSSMTSRSIDHLFAKCAITFLMGHVATHEYFSEIFSVFICLILTKSEFEVSGYSQSNLLHGSALTANFALSKG